MIHGVIVAATVGVATVALTPAVLRWLPEPVGAEGKMPYAEVGSPGFLLGCGLLSGGGAATAWAVLSLPVQPMWWVLSSAGLLLAAVDARTTWLPLRLTRVAWLMMTVAALAGVLWGGDWSVLLRAAFGAAIAGLLYLGFWRISRGGFGFGDVRFAPLLGAPSAAESWTLLISTLFLGTVVGAINGLVRLVRRRRGGFAYAPAMLAGAYLACATLALTG